MHLLETIDLIKRVDGVQGDLYNAIKELKMGSKYRFLYQDLEENKLYNHFLLSELKRAEIEAQGLKQEAARHAIAQMIRAHFSKIKPDGICEVTGKPAYLGRRFTDIYKRWGDDISIREASMDEPISEVETNRCINGALNSRWLWIGLAALLFLTLASIAQYSVSIRSDVSTSKKEAKTSHEKSRLSERPMLLPSGV